MTVFKSAVKDRKIPLKKQAELLDVNRTSAYYRPSLPN